MPNQQGRCSVTWEKRPLLLVAVFCLVGLVVVPGCLGAQSAAPELERWLELSYVETSDMAWFGQYPYELLETSTLYCTHGAVINATYNAIPVEDPCMISDWVVSLQQHDGAFDDPAQDAPALNETLWALQVLRLLGTRSDAISAVQPFLAQSLSELDLTGPIYDGEFSSALFALGLILDCAGELAAFGYHPEDTIWEGVRRELVSVSELVIPEIERVTAWEWSRRYEVVWAYVLASARIAPDSLSPEAVEFLKAQLEFIGDAPADFRSCAWIRDLLVACSNAFAWETVPKNTAEAIWEFLENSVFAIVADSGGFGWTDEYGVNWVDPHMTAPLLQICHLLDRRYPFAHAQSTTSAPLRVATGWGSQIQISRSVLMCYVALDMSRRVGWTDYDAEKLVAFFKSVILSPDSRAADILYAAKGWTAIEDTDSQLRANLVSRLTNSDTEWLLEDMKSVVELLYSFSLDVTNAELHSILESRRVALLDRQSQTMRMDLVWQLVMVDSLLGTESSSPHAVIEFVLSQWIEDGGFRMGPDLPESLQLFADTISTHTAIRILLHFGATDAVSRDMLLAYVDRCVYEGGYLIAPHDTLSRIGDPFVVDFVTTYFGLRLQDFVVTGNF